jgi:hypothetical protein
MNVVNLQDHKHQQLERQQEEAFREYVALTDKAQATRVLSDAIAAGKAWGRFVNLFCGAPQ